MEMFYYTIYGGRLAGLPGPAFMEWDFARLRKMGFSVVVSLECDRLNTFEIEEAGFEHKKICVEDFTAPTLACPPVSLLLPLLRDAFLQEIPDENRQPDRRINEALGHLRVLVELAPRLALLEGAAAQAAPLRHVGRDLGGVHVRVFRVPHDLLNHLDLGDVVLRRAAADVEHAGPRRLELDLRDLVDVLDRVEGDGLLAFLHAVVMVLRQRNAD